MRICVKAMLCLGAVLLLAAINSFAGSLTIVSSTTFSAPAPTITNPALGIGSVAPVATDANGNIFVAATTLDQGGNAVYLIVKFDRDLVLVSSTTYPESGSTGYFARGIAVDADGYVYVTGSRYGGSNYDYCTVKFNNALSYEQDRYYDSGANDYARAIAVDAYGNVFVTGSAMLGGSGNPVIHTVKYNGGLTSESASMDSFESAGGVSAPAATAICTDSQENVIVAGYKWDAGNSQFVWAIGRYDNGLTALNLMSYSSPVEHKAFAVAVDRDDKIYIAGSAGYSNSSNMAVAKFNTDLSQDGAGVSYDEGYSDAGYGICFDNKGNLLSCGGVSAMSGKTDGIVIKCSKDSISTMSSLTRIDDGGSETAYGVTTSTDNHVIVSGASTISGNLKLLVRKYLDPENLPPLDPAQDTTLVFAATVGDVLLTIPAHAFGEEITFTMSEKEVSLPQVNYIPLINAGIELKADKALLPQKDLTLTFEYAADVISGVDESKLVIFYQDPSTLRWLPVTNTVRDPQNDRISCTAKVFGTYVLCVSVGIADFRNVKVYPNPFSPVKNPGGLVFENITKKTKIRIYNVAGELVRTITDPSGVGTVTWDGKNEGGNYVGSGVYIVHLDGGYCSMKVKIIVER